MLRRDYLERLIEQFAGAIARVAGLVRDGKPEDALREADRAIASAAGMPWSMLAKLDPGTAFGLLERERVRVLADLLVARGVAARAAGDELGAGQAARLASELRARLGADGK
jgi:hypothetical protein